MLYAALAHNSVSYPINIPEFLEYIWDDHEAGCIRDEKLTEYLLEMGEWINKCEKGKLPNPNL